MKKNEKICWQLTKKDYKGYGQYLQEGGKECFMKGLAKFEKINKGKNNEKSNGKQQ